MLIYTRWKKIPLPLGLDVVIAGALFAQGIARWGNFFNQELYGPPTDLPWGIAIDCAHRVAPWLCPPQGTYDLNTGFQPLFFYESVLDILGGFVAPVHLAALSAPTPARAIWPRYGASGTASRAPGSRRSAPTGTGRSVGVPTAILVGIGLALFGVVWILYNHPRGKRALPVLTAVDARARTGQPARAGRCCRRRWHARDERSEGTDSDDDAAYEDDEDDGDDDGVGGHRHGQRRSRRLLERGQRGLLASLSSGTATRVKTSAQAGREMSDRLIEDYVRDVHVSAWIRQLPKAQTAALESEVRERIAADLTAAGKRDEATVQGVLDRLGPPSEFVDPQDAVPVTGARRAVSSVAAPLVKLRFRLAAHGWGYAELGGLALLIAGPFLLWWVGPILGIILIRYAADRWSNRAMHVATVVVFSLLAAQAILAVVLLVYVLATGGSAADELQRLISLGAAT